MDFEEMRDLDDQFDEIDYIGGDDEYEFEFDDKGKFDPVLLNQDFNLDSPLSLSVKSELIKCIKLHTTPSHHQSKIQKMINQLRSALSHSDIIRIKPVTSFHGLFTRYIGLDDKVVVTKIRLPVIISPNNISQCIKLIYKEIFEGKDSDLDMDRISGAFRLIFSEKDPNRELRSLLTRWLLFDNLVKIRNKIISGNSDSIGEDPLFTKIIKVKDHYKCFYTVQDKQGRYDTHTIIITGENYYIPHEESVLMHEEILMIKDTLFGRFASLFVVKFDISEKYSCFLYENLRKIFKIGDEILKSYGNSGYDALKMLEPVCVSRWITLNEDPEFLDLSDNFKKHIDEELGGNALGGHLMINIKKLVDQIESSYDVSAVFGSFRLWGHPYISEEEGLKKVKTLVREELIIDKEYPHELADDLAEICLRDHFNKTGTWGVDKSKAEGHILYPFIKEDIWPSRTFLDSNKVKWAQLPMIQIYKPPTDINISTLYSDKSHSCTKSELYESWKKNNKEPIKSHKVLKTLLEKQNIDPIAFLHKIALHGFDEDQKIIGLKDKERELKIFGRFFTLMSWEIREYIVLTEYLIKKFFLPHFSGITMSDGLTKIMKKMIILTEGQSSEDRKVVSIANHVDFEKWNNLQRHNSVGPVFRVMDKLLGFPGEVIERTHKLFSEVLVYFTSRPDKLKLLRDESGKISVDESFSGYGWNGQLGGFEGVRQKGWTVVGALLVLRESRRFNAKVNLLAQGDNQVIITNVRIPRGLGLNENVIKDIKGVNKRVLSDFTSGVAKLGLRLNHDETYSSSRFMIYGKVPIIKGCIINLETKKWARATCVSNDQLPTSGNIMGTIGTTAIGSQQFESDFKNSPFFYSVFGTLALFNSFCSNPLVINRPLEYDRLKMNDLIHWLYMDRSVGGFTGNAPSRFLIRQFPDPGTESLSFWRRMFKYDEFKMIANFAYNPMLSTGDSIWKLIENPTSLNIISGGNVEMILKGEVRKALINSSGKIENKLIRGALEYDKLSREPMESFLKNITPCFPRFLSEFAAGTEYGLADQIIGVIQNSRTMRNLFKNKFSARTQHIVLKFENFCLNKSSKGNYGHHLVIPRELECSSKRMDELRRISWKREIIGSTVPHPLDYLTFKKKPSSDRYVLCGKSDELYERLRRGKMKPYLGSKTSENTSVLTPWDKEIKNPLSRKAWRLLRSIDWFVDRDGELYNSLINNLKWLTGETNLSISDLKVVRTGTPLHRFGTDRMSNGGFISHSPNPASYLYISAEPLGDIRKINYDFMYQSTMLAIQAWSVTHLREQNNNFYGEWTCQMCLRPVEDDMKLSSSKEYNPEFYHQLYGLSRFINLDIEDRVEVLINKLHIKETRSISYNVGVNLGLVFSIQKILKLYEEQEASMFPLGIISKLIPIKFIIGILDGVRIGTLCSLFQRYRKGGDLDPRFICHGSSNYVLDLLARVPQAQNMFDISEVRTILIKESKFIPPSFPTSSEDIILVIQKAFQNLSISRSYEVTAKKLKTEGVVLYSDTLSDLSVVLCCIGMKLLPKIEGNIEKEGVNRLIWKHKRIFLSVLNKQAGINDIKIHKAIGRTGSELRHAVREDSINQQITADPGLLWEAEYTCETDIIPIYSEPKDPRGLPGSDMRSNKMENPLMRALRVNRLPTGAHYKIRGIICKDSILSLDPDMVFSIGDGSGGCGSMILRLFKNTKIFHNSLLGGLSLGGGSVPQIPSGYLVLRESDQKRCVNIGDYWKYPTDLRYEGVWTEMIQWQYKLNPKKLLIVCDAEVTSTEDMDMIETNMRTFLSLSLKRYAKISIIWKTYLDRILNKGYPTFVSCNDELYMGDPIMSSFNSTEVYLVIHVHDDVTRKETGLQPTEMSRIKICETILKRFENNEKLRRIKLLSEEPISKGIPIELKPNPKHSLVDVLSSMGIPNSVLLDLYKGRSKENSAILKMGLMKHVLEHNRVIYSDSFTELKTSRGKLINLGAFIMGGLGALLMCSPNLKILKDYENIGTFGFIYSERIETDMSGKFIKRSKRRYNDGKLFKNIVYGGEIREKSSILTRLLYGLRKDLCLIDLMGILRLISVDISSNLITDPFQTNLELEEAILDGEDGMEGVF